MPHPGDNKRFSLVHEAVENQAKFFLKANALFLRMFRLTDIFGNARQILEIIEQDGTFFRQFPPDGQRWRGGEEQLQFTERGAQQILAEGLKHFVAHSAQKMRFSRTVRTAQNQNARGFPRL